MVFLEKSGVVKKSYKQKRIPIQFYILKTKKNELN